MNKKFIKPFAHIGIYSVLLLIAVVSIIAAVQSYYSTQQVEILSEFWLKISFYALNWCGFIILLVAQYRLTKGDVGVYMIFNKTASLVILSVSGLTLGFAYTELTTEMIIFIAILLGFTFVNIVASTTRYALYKKDNI